MVPRRLHMEQLLAARAGAPARYRAPGVRRGSIAVCPRSVRNARAAARIASGGADPARARRPGIAGVCGGRRFRAQARRSAFRTRRAGACMGLFHRTISPRTPRLAPIARRLLRPAARSCVLARRQGPRETGQRRAPRPADCWH